MNMYQQTDIAWGNPENDFARYHFVLRWFPGNPHFNTNIAKV